MSIKFSSITCDVIITLEVLVVDGRFYRVFDHHTISQIAEFIGCIVEDQYGNIVIHQVKSLEEAGSGDITFLSNKKYLQNFQNTKASACIVPKDVAAPNDQIILLVSDNPYYAYAKLLNLFYSSAKKYENKIEQSAYISDSAIIGDQCYIGRNVVIEDNVTIGNGSIIDSNTVIKYGVSIGERAMIHSNVSISHSIIGDDVVILPGAKIGQDGFGFATNNGIHHKIYHVGKVVIGNNVEIGANTTIDRGSMHDTIIEDFCIIDNLVQIGHNVHVGKGSIIVAQAGIAGSSKVGKYCALGGQVGVAGHLTIGDNVQIAAQGGAIQDIMPNSIVGGTPTVPIRDWHKQSVIMKQLIQKRNNGN